MRFSLRKKISFSLVLLVALWGLTELVCLAGLWALRKYKGIEYRPGTVQTLSAKHRGLLEDYLSERPGYLMIDRQLGWTVRPAMTWRRYKTNRAGIRADREYTLQQPPGMIRLAAFGDSFTHASDVANAYTWERALEELEPRFEVLNFGVPAHEPGQAFLRYQRDGVRFHPHIVLIGFMSENIYRAVNTFRPFYFVQSGLPLSKPRFALRRGRLVLIENPIPDLQGYRELLRSPETVLPRIGRNDYFYQRSRPHPFDFLPSVRLAAIAADRYDQPVVTGGVYNRDSEPYQVTLAILEAFYARVRADGAQPVIVLFPTRDDIVLGRAGKTVLYKPLREDLERKGYRVVDLLDGFLRHDPEGFILRRNFIHYPRYGNQIAARTLLDYLQANGLTTPKEARPAHAPPV